MTTEIAPQKRFLLNLLEGISRITSGRAFIAHVDGLRFLAIMSVVYSHVCASFLTSFGLPAALNGAIEWNLKNSIFANLVFCGRYGVHLFFLLSGFLLSSPFAKARLVPETQAPSLKAYYLRRVARIEPPFIISLLLIYLLKFFATGDFLPSHLVASAFYSHLVVFKEPSLINDVLWSLEVEIQFYILAPLLASIFAFKYAWLRRSIIAAFILFWGYLVPFLQASTPQSLLWYLHYFAGGFLLADLHVCGQANNSIRPKGYLWDIAGLLVFGVCIEAILSGKSDLYCPAALFLFTLAVFKGPVLNKIFSFKPIVIIGGMCYTIYLYHNQMFSAAIAMLQAAGLKLTVLPFSLPWFLYVFLAVCIVLPACVVLFVCFERPFMHNRWYRDMREMLPSTRQYLLWVPLIFISLALVGGFTWPVRVLRQIQIKFLSFHHNKLVAEEMSTQFNNSSITARTIVSNSKDPTNLSNLYSKYFLAGQKEAKARHCFASLYAYDKALETKPGDSSAENAKTKTAHSDVCIREFQQVVLIPAGSFAMGISNATNARIKRPVKNIYLDAYYIDKNLVTVREYREFASAAERPVRPQGPHSVDHHPVTNVTWNDADAYCRWVGKRLPSEAEWEKAALAGNVKLWNFGTDFFRVAGFPWYHKTREDAQKHSYGIQDMNWKLLEWCSDWYGEDYYDKVPACNPQGPPSGKFKVWRGGTWALNVVLPYAGLNLTIKPEHFNGVIGFRCATDAK